MKYENKLLNYYNHLYQDEFFSGKNADYTLMTAIEDIIFLGIRCRHYRERIGNLKKQVQNLNKQIRALYSL